MKKQLLRQRIDQVRPLLINGFTAYLVDTTGYIKLWYNGRQVLHKSVKSIEHGAEEKVVVL